MQVPAYIFLISPPDDADEGAFEKSLGRFLRETAHGFSQRVVAGTSQTLFLSRDQKEARKYVWRLELVTVGGMPAQFGSAFDELLAKLQKHVGPKGTVTFVACADAVVANKS